MTSDRFSALPKPPYYAVIFANQLAEVAAGYEAMADKIFELAQQQPGYLGAESTRDGTGFGITVSYWKDEASITAWKAVSEHLVAQNLGIERWYTQYNLRVAKVERAYCGPAERRV